MAYLSIEEDLISGENKKKAIDAAKASNPDATYMAWDGLTEETNEIVFEEGKIIYSAHLFKDGEEAGYIDVNVPISLDLAAEIVGFYIKKLNRLKTVLEATKE